MTTKNIKTMITGDIVVDWRECPIKGHHIRTTTSTERRVLVLRGDETGELQRSQGGDGVMAMLACKCISSGKLVKNRVSPGT